MKHVVQILGFVLLSSFSTMAGAVTPLQKHVGFFDEDENGLITIMENYNGLRKLGFDIWESAKIATIVGLVMGPKTYYSILDVFSLNITNINKSIHDSDTGIYDKEGNFNEQTLRDLFSKFDTNQDGALSEEEINVMLEANAETYFGHSASRGEFAFLMRLGSENKKINGKATPVVTYETMVEMYEGRLLYQVAKNLALQKKGPVKSDL